MQVTALLAAIFAVLVLALPSAGAKTKPVPSCDGVPVSAGFCGFDKHGQWKYTPIKIR